MKNTNTFRFEQAMPLDIIKMRSNVSIQINQQHIIIFRSSHPEVFLERDVLKICSKFTGEHPCRSVISIKLQNNFIEMTLQHGCSPVNLLHIFRTSSSKNTSGWLLLNIPPKILRQSAEVTANTLQLLLQ